MKDYIKDLKYKCIKRLFYAEDMLDKYLNTAGRDKYFFDSLKLEGAKEDLRHPILDYDESERECFVFVCGSPLQLPDSFVHDSAEYVRQMIIKRRNELRLIAGMIDNMRWLGEKNYLGVKSRKKRYFTGRLVG